jgi:hypothetical protein
MIGLSTLESLSCSGYPGGAEGRLASPNKINYLKDTAAPLCASHA